MQVAHVKDFLLAIPINVLGLHMSLVEYHVILRCWLMIPLFPIDDVFHVFRKCMEKKAFVSFLIDLQKERSTLKPKVIMVCRCIEGKHACVNLTEVSPLV